MRSAIFLLIPLACGAALRVERPANLPAPARYGLDRLAAAAAPRNVSGDFVIRAALGCPAAKAPQSFSLRRSGRTLHICGADGPGLMYAALDVADRLTPGDPFSAIRDTAESPFLAERGISLYTMQRAFWESRLHDENHWRRYFDLLARSRINALTIIFGYENGGFLAPVYPYFFEVDGHPQVRFIGITPEEQQRNAAAFRTLIRLAHERGIDVIPAIWDHIYRGGVQGGGIPGASTLAGKDVPGLVSGLTEANLAPYTKAALRRFLEVFPEIDGLEFRMHNESGLKREEMPAFWHEVFAMLARFKPGLRLTLRAKELPDEIIDDALRQGLHARIETKYWMEQMGLPFHPTHVNRQNQKDRRHGYADLLQYPQRYRVHWRLWSGGTTRLLLWGDPEYARRFVASAKLYGGNSFDVNEMLATKMLGEPHEKPPLPIHNLAYRHYDDEFERYWHFFAVWGRIGYNPQTPSDVFEREFRLRFGGSGPALMQGLHLASRVLPRIVAASYRYQLFPTTRGWAEMMRQGDLPTFSAAEGTDIEQFMNPRDAARSLLAATPTSLRRPEETSRWFTEISAAILEQVKRAGSPSGAEARATLADLQILAALARFHAARLLAAVDYNLFRESRNPAALDRAIARETGAVAAWEDIVAAAADVYSFDLAFGVHAVGFPRHWKEELTLLRAGLEKLRAERAQVAGSPAPLPALPVSADTAPPTVRFDPVTPARPGTDYRVAVRAGDASGIQSLRLRYRHLTQFEDYASVPFALDPKSGRYAAAIPGAFITPQWDLICFVEAIDTKGNGRNYPDLETEAPYVIIPVRR